jgi:hypothetical protein
MPIKQIFSNHTAKNSCLSHHTSFDLHQHALCFCDDTSGYSCPIAAFFRTNTTTSNMDSSRMWGNYIAPTQIKNKTEEKKEI